MAMTSGQSHKSEVLGAPQVFSHPSPSSATGWLGESRQAATALHRVRYRSSREDAGRLRRPTHRSRFRASGARPTAVARRGVTLTHPAWNRRMPSSSSAIHASICGRMKSRGDGSCVDPARKRAARNKNSSCCCSDESAAAAASISGNVVIRTISTVMSEEAHGTCGWQPGEICSTRAPLQTLDISYCLYRIIQLDKYRCIHEYSAAGCCCHR